MFVAHVSSIFLFASIMSLVAWTVKRLPTMWETWVQSLGHEDPLEKEMATHSSIDAWKIPRTEEPGGLQSMGSQRVGMTEGLTLVTCDLTNDLDDHDGVITHLEPDILECQVKRALGNITTNKTSGGGELFQMLKDDAVKVPHTMCQQIWKNQQWTQSWKRSVFISIPKKGNAKKCSSESEVAQSCPTL